MELKFDFATLETGYEALWPVKVMTPIDGGAFEERTFTARFRSLTPEKADELAALPRAAQIEATIREIFVGLGPDETTPFSPELRDRMWASDYVQIGLIKAVSEFRTGAALKN